LAKDIIIGGASNYSWEHLKYWVNSIAKSGFTGDVILIATNITKETIDKLSERGVKVSLYGKRQEDGSFKADSKGAPHVERFFYIWNTLNQLNKNEYRYVITTDTRDVVFGKNPSDWLRANLKHKMLVCSSEGLKYEDEPWGNQNLLETFGPFFHNILKGNIIYNVGTIAGEFDYVKDLLLMIFQMSINRPIPIVDQAVFNFLIQQEPYKDVIHKAANKDRWAVQLGTSLAAVKSGHGDIGKICQQNPTELISYQMKYTDDQPDVDNLDFTIIHQYDRVNGLKDKIEKLYGDM
jgi:hypothetical protein